MMVMMILMMSTLVPAAGAGKERQNVKTTRDVAVVNAAVKSLLSVNVGPWWRGSRILLLSQSKTNKHVAHGTARGSFLSFRTTEVF